MSIRPLDLRASGNNVRRQSDFVDRTVGAVWRAFDFQMVVYAALLACFGLAMAYSNTVAGGVGLFDGGSTLLRGLMWLAIAIAVFLVSAAFPFVWTYVLQDYQKARLTAFLNPGADVQGAGFQLFQSQIAVGLGGWFGVGLTNGQQNAQGLLPVQDTDFVFAILAEELGFVGAMVVVLLFVGLLWRVLVAGWRSKDPFGTIFACGVAAWLLFKLVVNVGMVIGMMPITGIPLPFISHGGASLISIAIALGVLQSINIRQGRAEW